MSKKKKKKLPESRDPLYLRVWAWITKAGVDKKKKSNEKLKRSSVEANAQNVQLAIVRGLRSNVVKLSEHISVAWII